MWKTVGVSLLRFGVIYSVFGVFGVLFYLVKWFRPMWQRTQPQPNDSDTS